MYFLKLQLERNLEKTPEGLFWVYFLGSVLSISSEVFDKAYHVVWWSGEFCCWCSERIDVLVSLTISKFRHDSEFAKGVFFIRSLPELYLSKSNVPSISKDVLGLVSSPGDFPEKSTCEKNSIIDWSVARAAPPPFTFDNWIRSSILPTPYWSLTITING
mgnify:CR=1 FL=1